MSMKSISFEQGAITMAFANNTIAKINLLGAMAEAKRKKDATDDESPEEKT